MIFWILWFVGIAITIITRLLINKAFTGSFAGDFSGAQFSLKDLKKGVKVLLHLLAIVCIVLVGGIAVALFINFMDRCGIVVQILTGIFSAFLTYVVGTGILGLYKFDDLRSEVCFVVVFIIAVLSWIPSINIYNRNVETGITETVIEQTQQRDLLYFCNVPVQNVTGKISETYSILGGSVSGSVDTAHELTYWYASENEKALLDTAPANSSEIVFIKESEVPYVEIIRYYQCEKQIDHNIGGFEHIYEENRWTQYVFHLPESIMQYNLN